MPVGHATGAAPAAGRPESAHPVAPRITPAHSAAVPALAVTRVDTVVSPMLGRLAATRVPERPNLSRFPVWPGERP
ncbi:hypothetical protein RE9431_19520 [Prescottella equi]|nr:hypothetical protein RE9416_19320 [Prescottella equi]BCN63497.1 hypothetical protein RE9431_19520 [Prescottella equi]BCN73347.1 hypothetical protein RE0327_19460 [Prescottella equi]BCN83360.1 hypothetical protein RE0356_20010 [Prescottella equi]